MTIEDLLLVVSIGIENIQYIALGPNFSVYNFIGYVIINYLSLNFNYLYEFNG